MPILIHRNSFFGLLRKSSLFSTPSKKYLVIKQGNQYKIFCKFFFYFESVMTAENPTLLIEKYNVWYQIWKNANKPSSKKMVYYKGTIRS